MFSRASVLINNFVVQAFRWVWCRWAWWSTRVCGPAGAGPDPWPFIVRPSTPYTPSIPRSILHRSILCRILRSILRSILCCILRCILHCILCHSIPATVFSYTVFFITVFSVTILPVTLFSVTVIQCSVGEYSLSSQTLYFLHFFLRHSSVKK